MTSEQQQLELGSLDIEARDDRGWSNVHIAVHNNRPEVLEFLLKKGANVCVYNDNGESPLHFAASLDSQPIACTLLKRLPRDKVREFLDKKTKERGTSALHVAAKNGAFGVVWLLLSYGANFEIENHARKRPVDVTREVRIERLLKIVELDSKFAEQSFPGLSSRLQTHPFFELDASLHSRNDQGLTILQLAVINENVDAVEKIVELRTCKDKDEEPAIELLMSLKMLGQCCDDMKRQLNSLLKMCDDDDDDDDDEIHEPMRALEVGKKLLSTGLKVTRLYRGEQQHLSVIDETLEVLEFDGAELVDENARYHRKFSTEKKTELYSFLDILKLTIGAPIALLLNTICTVYLGSSSQRSNLTSLDQFSMTNPDLNKQDANGWTPLHFAVHNDKEKMVKALLELKSNATLVTKKNRKTPLHMAVKNGNVKIVELLLEHVVVDGYADEKSEPKGLTALHLAVKMGRLDIVRCLLRKGAKFRVKDKKGRMCVELTKDVGILGLLRIIEELFEIAENGESQDIVRKVKELNKDDLNVVVNARDESGRCLTTIAKLKCDEDVYLELLSVVSDALSDEKRKE